MSTFKHGLLGLVVLFVGFHPVCAQGPGGERPRWSPVGFDPNVIFDAMDRNKDGVVTRDELLDRRSRDRFDDYVRRAGVTDGRLTREAFLKAFEQRQTERARGFSRTEADRMFRELDVNSDGKLDDAELLNALRLWNELDRWDKNKDSKIDLHEFEAFLLSQFRSGSTAEVSAPPADKDAQHGKPAEPIYRAGKLPADIPDWFKEWDADGDGMVALYEWQGTMAEFQAIDRNNDGFITIAEVMAWMKSKAKPESPAPVSKRENGKDK
jgi:Ca2+-binding EF-hand superfamily protein